MSEPANEQQQELAPIEADDVSMDENFAAFLNHSFGEPEGQDEDHGAEGQGQDTEAGSETTTDTAAATVAGGEGQDSISAAAGSDNAAPAASGNDTQAAAADPEFDPADLAAMMGLGDDKQEPAGSEPPPKTDTSAESAEDEKTFMPFQPTFKLAPEIVSGIFEAEDLATREKALVTLLSNFGNALTQTLENRFREFHAPRMLSDAVGRVKEEQTVSAINQHFYGKVAPDLQPYKKAVQSAFQVILKKDPTATYSEEFAGKVASLARASLKSAGIALAAPPVVPKPAGAKPVNKAAAGKAPGSGFEAGGSRQSGAIAAGDSGPADLVAQLSEF